MHNVLTLEEFGKENSSLNWCCFPSKAGDLLLPTCSRTHDGCLTNPTFGVLIVYIFRNVRNIDMFGICG